MANPYGEKKVNEHVKEISEATQLARQYFNLPEHEKVIQVYGCTRKGIGKMYITQNHIGFYASLPKCVETFPFRKVAKIEKVKVAAILIVLEDGTNYEFGSFTQRDECYAILKHLLDNPPAYMLVDTKKDVAPKSPRISVNDGTMGTLPMDDEQAQATEQRGKVDKESARRGVAKMNQAKQMGVATLEELDRQREVVHGMDQRLENMTADLKHNERHLRGIESIGGAIANKATKDKTKRKDLVFESREEKIMQVQKRDAEVEVLFKFANDKLVPALLIFKEKVFVCAEAGNKTKLVMTGAQWEYSEVKMILLRARHQHLDVWFKTGGKEKRIRMMTSHVQWVTNEFALRCGPELDVQFEPGVKKFDFGSVELAQLPLPRGRKDDSNGGWGNAGGKSKTSGLISKNAPKEVHDDIAEQDEYLDQMANGLDELQHIAVAIGDEVEDSTRKIAAVRDKTVKVSDTVHSQNRRVEKVLKK